MYCEPKDNGDEEFESNIFGGHRGIDKIWVKIQKILQSVSDSD